MTPEELYAQQQQYSGNGIAQAVANARQINANNNADAAIPIIENAPSQVVSQLNQMNADSAYKSKMADRAAIEGRRDAMLDAREAKLNAAAGYVPGQAPASGLGGNVLDGIVAQAPTQFNGKYIKTENHNLGKGLYNAHTKTYGSKATRNFNPGNITGMSGKLLYGAIGMADSPVGDKGDRSQLVFNTPKAGFQAMHQLAMNNYSGAPINKSFSKWQTDQNSFKAKLNDLSKNGINTGSKYSALSPEQQGLFRKIWSQHEGYRGEFY